MAIRWLEDNGKWYYFRPWNHEEFDGKNAHDGRMQTGWIKDNGKWYYLNENGDMAAGWIFVNGRWYYLNADGAYAEGAMDVLAQRYSQLPEQVRRYIGTLSGQADPRGNGDAAEALLRERENRA